MAKIYIIHENDQWTVHLTRRLEELHLPYETWHLAEGTVDLSATPPEGIFFSRMSASAHTRNHRFAPELTGAVFAWLEHHGRTVFNGSTALALELSKVNQYMALEKAGIRTPKTIAAVGKEQIIKAAEQLGKTPFILKPNRAGKGLGVQLFHTIDALKAYVNDPLYEEPIDGISLIQEYIKSPDQYIVRAEFIGGQFFYAVKVDTSSGFELCPADACQIDDLFCPAGQPVEEKPKFEIIDDVDKQQMATYEAFLAAHRITVAGIEFIKDEQGKVYTYDINTNTNYNSDAEQRAGKYGMLQLALFLKKQLELHSAKLEG